MIKKIFFFKFLLLIFIANNLHSAINNSIIAYVGNSIITSEDIQNKIITTLILSNQNINQKNIDNVKQFALKSIIRGIIKKKEIEKYEVTEFNKKDLNNHILKLASSKGLSTEQGVKEFFNQNNLNFEEYIENVKINLKWNTFIYRMYGNQITINKLEIENDLKEEIKERKETKEYNLSEIEIELDTSNLNEVIENIYNKVKKDGFESAVQKYSISNSISNNGNLGWINEKSLSSLLVNQLSIIKKNQITRPITIQDKIIFLKINNIRKLKADEINIENLKNIILRNKKEEKLNLFSRSHFSKIENSTLIKIK